MKKNKVLLISGGFLYVLIIALTVMFIMIPGIKKIAKSREIIILSEDEKTVKKQEIDQKYLALENKIVTKYDDDLEIVNTGFDNTEESIKSKYDKLEDEIKAKYDNEEKNLQTQISNYDYLIHNEFRANGFSKKYYELSDKRSELYDKKGDLFLDEAEEKSENDDNERDELKKNEKDRNESIKTYEDNKKRELASLSEQKENELNSIINQSEEKNTLKREGNIKIIWGVVIILIPLIYVVIQYNGLTRSANSVKEKWSQIDVYLKQRYDLIPNLVEVVKGYAKHEKGVYINVTKARNKFLKADNKEDEIQASLKLEHAINKLFFLQENYPELKADSNFRGLQNDLREVEDKISYLRQSYNRSVLRYKNKLEMFPSNVIANLFNFQSESFFKIDDEERENVIIDSN